MNKEKYLKDAIYGLDKLTIEFMLRIDDAQLIMDRLEYEPSCKPVKSNRRSACYHGFHYDLPDNNSFYIGFEPNWLPFDKHAKTGRIEFNPAKVSEYKEFQQVLTWIAIRAGSNIKAVRFDLSIDIPVSRDRVYLLKDKRTYQEYSNSTIDRTQYLGKRNSHGFIKVYNKALELKLENMDLTRIELTISNDTRSLEDVKSILPTIYILDDLQYSMDLTDTDSVLLRAVLRDMEELQRLSRRKREKIEAYLACMLLDLSINEIRYNSILHQIDDYVNYGLLEVPNMVPSKGQETSEVS